ncbi:hypothetical protein SSBG_05968 [Streptomyces sp. SPB074]|nr:hypothetical protein SSBG_05968 [Streptomyces sp. SPB074]
MRTLISTALVPLDGVMEAPGGETGHRNAGWSFRHVAYANGVQLNIFDVVRRDGTAGRATP